MAKKTRVKGKRRFIVIHGLLAWGAPMFVIMTFFVNDSAVDHITTRVIAINACIWALGGLAFGYFTWILSERSYQNELKMKQHTADDQPKNDV